MSQATKIEERLCPEKQQESSHLFLFRCQKKCKFSKLQFQLFVSSIDFYCTAKKNPPKRTHHKSSTALQDAKAMASTFRHLRGHVGRRAKAATKEPRHLDLSVIRKEGFGMFGRMVCLRSLENHHFLGHERIKSYSNHNKSYDRCFFTQMAKIWAEKFCYRSPVAKRWFGTPTIVAKNDTQYSLHNWS